jgi:hypothetical protein
MKRVRVMVWVGLVGVAGLVTGCTEDKELRTYMGQNGQLYEWEQAISKAVCNLEVKTGTTTGDILCPGGTYPPSITPPPKYPPN